MGSFAKRQTRDRISIGYKLFSTISTYRKTLVRTKKANGARVINVSSQGHQFSPFNFDDPNFLNREYETLAAYGQSKTAVNLFSLELDNRARYFNKNLYSGNQLFVLIL